MEHDGLLLVGLGALIGGNMYKEKIRRLENVLAEQTRTIDLLKEDTSKASELKILIEQRSTTLSELSQLRRMQYEEEHERVHFDDDR